MEAWCKISFSDYYSNPLLYAKHLYLNDVEITSLEIPNTVTFIGSYAFENCIGLTSVTIPSSVTSIGDCAFYECNSLTSITIPSSVTSIGGWAFCNCSNITSVIIPSSVTSIGDCAFYECNSLTSITIPSSVTSIGNFAFAFCSKITKIQYNANKCSLVTLDYYKNPSNIIGSFAFIGSESIGVTLEIGESVTTLSEDFSYSFFGTPIFTLNIPKSITEFEYGDLNFFTKIKTLNYYSNAFLDNQVFSGLGSESTEFNLIIGNSITEIPAHFTDAFCDYNNNYDLICNITSITIPKTVSSIGEKAFANCIKVKTLNYNANCSTNDDFGEKEIFNDLGSEASTLTINIGESVKEIPTGFLYSCCENVTTVNISEGVTSIGDWAFCNCSNITSVIIPSSVTSVGTEAFYGCSNITKVNITDMAAWCKIKFSSSGSNPLYYAKHLYLNNKEVTSLEIPEGVTVIGDYAFYNCNSITSVTIPSSVTSVGTEAFYDCSNLTKVNITDMAAWCKIKFIKANANPLYYTQHLYLNNKEVTSLEIPAGVTSIGDWAFYNCSSITSVTIPSSVTFVGTEAFAGCSNITKVNITDIAAWCKINFSDIDSNPLYYVKHLYLNNKEMTSLEIPEEVTSIGDRAFYNCSSITSVTIPSSVTSIGDSAFCNCSNITSVIIPSSVTSIGGSAFAGCSNITKVNITDIAAWCKINFSDRDSNPLYYAQQLYLNNKEVTSLEIPAGVTSIGDRTFCKCSNITSVIIPSSVTSVGTEAFYDCSNLTKVNITDIAAWCKINFANSYSNPLKYAHHLYLNGEEISSLVIPDTITSIGDYAFYNCNSITSVIIPSSVTSIGLTAFYNCSNLQKITFNDITTWYKTKDLAGWQNKRQGSQTDVSTSTTNATYFKNTYCNYYWYKL